MSEQLFTLTKTSSVTRRPPAHCSSPEIAFAQRCADIDLNLDGDDDEECINLQSVTIVSLLRLQQRVQSAAELG